MLLKCPSVSSLKSASARPAGLQPISKCPSNTRLHQSDPKQVGGSSGNSSHPFSRYTRPTGRPSFFSIVSSRSQSEAVPLVRSHVHVLIMWRPSSRISLAMIRGSAVSSLIKYGRKARVFGGSISNWKNTRTKVGRSPSKSDTESKANEYLRIARM